MLCWDHIPSTISNNRLSVFCRFYLAIKFLKIVETLILFLISEIIFSVFYAQVLNISKINTHKSFLNFTLLGIDMCFINVHLIISMFTIPSKLCFNYSILWLCITEDINILHRNQKTITFFFHSWILFYPFFPLLFVPFIYLFSFKSDQIESIWWFRTVFMSVFLSLIRI